MEKYKFRINGKPYEVEVDSVSGDEAKVRVNGEEYSVEIESSDADEAASREVSAATVSAGINTKPSPSSKATGATVEVTSPLPGVIVEIKVTEGQSVKAGECVAVLEAMKMENEIEATASGTVTAICAAKGDSVPEGAVIIRIG